MRHTLCFLVLATLCLSGCEGHNSRTENMVGGSVAGAATGGVVGAVCCGNPVAGIPAGILIGGAAGGIVGFIWPTEDVQTRK